MQSGFLAFHYHIRNSLQFMTEPYLKMWNLLWSSSIVCRRHKSMKTIKVAMTMYGVLLMWMLYAGHVFYPEYISGEANPALINFMSFSSIWLWYELIGTLVCNTWWKSTWGSQWRNIMLSTETCKQHLKKYIRSSTKLHTATTACRWVEVNILILNISGLSTKTAKFVFHLE